MATITKRKNGWFAQIRRQGYEPEYKTFRLKTEAQKWAREREARIDQGAPAVSQRVLRGTTLGDLIRRYIDEVTPTKLGAESERLRLSKLLAAPMCDIALSDLTSAPIAAYRDARAKVVKPGTIARELGLLRTIVEVARLDWGVSIATNVVSQVRRIPVKNARDRRLNPGEFDRLMVALQTTRNKQVRPAVLLAVETALRRGELLNLKWSEIDLERRTANIPHTKTGYARTIPLTDAALMVLSSMPRDGDRLFHITAMSLRLAWNRVRERAGMPDLNFHDLRHEAISRFAEMGLTTVELAVISGHRDMRMLMRYTHLKPADLARKLAGRSWNIESGHSNVSV
ncbi:integrase [Sphingomonas sp. Ag1]|jgi:integrase|uniref:integrase n=1 Tax=Sphingomonas sp. Ag1 TaxID=1642949 RepID=UPI0009E39F1A|nr:site-specific integrase [Sphingomonas sp. Ag1]